LYVIHLNAIFFLQPVLFQIPLLLIFSEIIQWKTIDVLCWVYIIHAH